MEMTKSSTLLFSLILLNSILIIQAEVNCYSNVVQRNINFVCTGIHEEAGLTYEEKMVETIHFLREDVVNAQSISINIENSSFSKLDVWIASPFKITNSIDKVTNINLEGCNIANISSNSLSSFKKLHSLNLKKNSIADYKFFLDLDSLKNIYFSHNKIIDLDDFAKKLTAYGISSRDYLEIANCSLTSFTISARQNMYLVFIKEINLSFNNIVSVFNEYSSDLKLNLTLRGNSNLKTLNRGVFSKLDLSEFDRIFDLSLLKGVTVYDTLFIQNNKINVLDKSLLNINDVVKSGANIDFSSSEIEYIKGHFFENCNLNVLNLSYNNLYPGIYPYEFRNTNIKTLDLTGSQISDISSIAFCNFTSDTLILSANKLLALGDIFTDECNVNIANLDLSNNKILKLEQYDLRYIKNLQNLNLSLNAIVSYDNDSFFLLDDLKSLEITVPNGSNISAGVLKSDSLMNITFRDSNITYLNDDNFMGLSALQELRLENCTIGNMTNNSLDGLFYLKYLDKNILKRHLNITSLPWGIFKDLYSITELDLSKIYLTNLDSRSFVGLENVVYLNISNNFFPKINSDTFQTLSKLIKLDLSFCYIVDPLPPGVFSSQKNLKYLSLKGNPTNDLVTTGVLTNLENLIILDLSNNKWRGLDVSALVTLKELKMLFLDYNHLSLSIFPQFRYKNLTEYLPKLEYIGISGNRWECNLLSDMLSHFAKNNIRYDPILPVTNVTNIDGIQCTE